MKQKEQKEQSEDPVAQRGSGWAKRWRAVFTMKMSVLVVVLISLPAVRFGIRVELVPLVGLM